MPICFRFLSKMQRVTKLTYHIHYTQIMWLWYILWGCYQISGAHIQPTLYLSSMYCHLSKALLPLLFLLNSTNWACMFCHLRKTLISFCCSSSTTRTELACSTICRRRSCLSCIFSTACTLRACVAFCWRRFSLVFVVSWALILLKY